MSVELNDRELIDIQHHALKKVWEAWTQGGELRGAILLVKAAIYGYETRTNPESTQAHATESGDTPRSEEPRNHEA